MATGLTTVISQASEKGGHAQLTRRSPTCITLHPSRSISMKQSDLEEFCSIINDISSERSTNFGLSQTSKSNSFRVKEEICPLFTLGLHSAFRNIVDTDSSVKIDSSESGSKGWSPNDAMHL